MASRRPSAPHPARRRRCPALLPWAFALEPIGEDATQLITRVRADYASSVKLALVTSLMSAAHAVMGRAQLRHIKRRAERLAMVG